MSDELFEVAFSGQIKDGADLEQVKAKVAAMFKADATKLAHLFSGKRMVIKKNIDQATANKYKTALGNAGAVCEVKSLSEALPNVSSAQRAPEGQLSEVKEAKKREPELRVTEEAAPSVTPTAQNTPPGNVPDAPQTAPLGIVAEDISELSAGIAPLGSDMQDGVKAAVAPELDLSGLDMAPPGSDLGQTKKADEPPPPNTDGLSLTD